MLHWAGEGGGLVVLSLNVTCFQPAVSHRFHILLMPGTQMMQSDASPLKLKCASPGALSLIVQYFHTVF